MSLCELSTHCDPFPWPTLASSGRPERFPFPVAGVKRESAFFLFRGPSLLGLPIVVQEESHILVHWAEPRIGNTEEILVTTAFLLGAQTSQYTTHLEKAQLE